MEITLDKLEIGDICRVLRLSEGMTQAELAQKSGVGDGVIFRIEHGDDAKFYTVEAILNTLGYGLDIKKLEK